MAATSSMFMYSLTLMPPTAIHQAIVGQFAGVKDQQILTASGARLTLKEPNHLLGKIADVVSHDCFGIIRSLAPFRVAGASKDLILVGSDAGRIAILEYLPEEKRFVQLSLETFGKSGVRRVVPGQYLAADPKGRACMIASVEKNKLVYILNRSPEAKVIISSPLEAHKPHSLLFALIGLDVGYENPIFAALEVDYGEAEQDPSGDAYNEIKKELVYYELDLGLNHVVRKWTDEVDRTANMLFQVPGGSDGPSGVLVCAEENITYRHSNQDAFRVPIPRRRGATEDPGRKRSITAGTMHKMRDTFFFLLQTEDGDVFKVTIDMVKDKDGDPTGEVGRLKIKYFDTVPPATSFCILKRGFLFVATESGNHIYYQFEKLGDDDDEIEYTSDDFPADPRAAYTPVTFHPRPLENLTVAEIVPSMNPLMGLKAMNLTGTDTPQLYSISGTGARSSFKSLRHGLDVMEIVESPLPQIPTHVFTVKIHKMSEYDSFIILSFPHESLVLSISDTVEEATQTGFLTNVPTIAVEQMGEDAMLQVHPKGIRHIESTGKANDWPCPEHRSVVAASCNNRQVAVALSSGAIVYFEMDANGSLNQYDDERSMTGTVTSLSLGPIPEGRVRSDFLAVGCDDNTVRILSLDPDSLLENKSIQALTSAPNSLQIMSMIDSSSGGSTLYLHIGLWSGVYIRTVLDEGTGDLSDTRTRFLGPKPVKLSRVEVQGQTAVLALCTRPWLGYSDGQSKMFTITPLDYQPLEYGWSFHSEQCPHGMVGIQEERLRYVFSTFSSQSNDDSNLCSFLFSLRTQRKYSNCSF
jgi:splicing factor 3B subunit 3